MKFGWFDGGNDGEHNDVGFVEVSEIYLAHTVCIVWNRVIQQRIVV